MFRLRPSDTSGSPTATGSRTTCVRGPGRCFFSRSSCSRLHGRRVVPLARPTSSTHTGSLRLSLGLPRGSRSWSRLGVGRRARRRLPWLFRPLLRRAQLWCAPLGPREDARALGARDVRVIPSGIDIPDAVSADGSSALLYVGRLSKEKGIRGARRGHGRLRWSSLGTGGWGARAGGDGSSHTTGSVRTTNGPRLSACRRGGRDTGDRARGNGVRPGRRLDRCRRSPGCDRGRRHRPRRATG